MHGQERGRGFRVKSALRRTADALVIDHTSQLPTQRVLVVPGFDDVEAHRMFKTCGTQKKVPLQLHGQLSIFTDLFQPKPDASTGRKDVGKCRPVSIADDLAGRLCLSFDVARIPYEIQYGRTDHHVHFPDHGSDLVSVGVGTFPGNPSRLIESYLER